jgi:pimeloyl-ACP methyl ester carboxylesterase
MTVLIDGRGDGGSADRRRTTSSSRARPEEPEVVALTTTITHRFLRTGTAVHHFVLAGSATAPAVLLLGGRPDSWWTWHARIEALSPGHFVVASAQLDRTLRAEHVVAVLADLGVDRVHVVAEAEGAALAAAVAGALGDAVASTACLGTGPLAHLEDAELANRAIIEWLELREQTLGGRRRSHGAHAGSHVPEGQ